ncbi:hypothetical protein BS78_06G038400 [Paspalum vaginatum]|nr:hypothetical protein BS78_06G038400 [Paspalum vaginatum]
MAAPKPWRSPCSRSFATTMCFTSSPRSGSRSSSSPSHVMAYNMAISWCARTGALLPRAGSVPRDARPGPADLRTDEYTLLPLLNSVTLLRRSAQLLRAGLSSHLHITNALVDAYTKLLRERRAGPVRRNAASGHGHLALATRRARMHRRPPPKFRS